MPGSQEINKQVRESLSRKSGDSQLDLFIALPSDLPARDQQDLMERPFFSLSKNKRTTPIEYRVGDNYIHVSANEKYQIPSDLVVKSQGADIIDLILQIIGHPAIPGG
jgi:plasmid replication initiation protein